MRKQKYELAQSVGKFDEGVVLEVTARFGNGYLYDVRLEPTHSATSGSIKLTTDRLETVAKPTEVEA